jgi:hypothetical protein
MDDALVRLHGLADALAARLMPALVAWQQLGSARRAGRIGR